MRKLKGLACCAAFALAVVAGAQTNSEDNYGSLFPPKFKNPFLDRTARNVGDILTVVVSENATSNVTASTTATKKDSNAVTAPFVGSLKIPLLKQIIGDLSTTADSSVAGAGNSTNTSTLSAKVAVIVKEVMPNGNLVVEGTRWVKVNKEETNITFTGIVRRDDVRADDTVLSENVAEAKITNVSKGLIAERQRKGFLTRLLDWLF
ncbi:MAG TPA: flagellar basal body L-ring protein FlgH [Fimbriimonadaceae bacterium]|nr:flagellar basal body L-ring protein FlgH [Fimbriimonadaceae bacterium]